MWPSYERRVERSAGRDFERSDLCSTVQLGRNIVLLEQEALVHLEL